MHEWIKKLEVIYIHVCVCVYNSAIKKNEILPFATTEINLEGIMESEVSQTEKDKYYCMIPLTCGI